MDLLREDYSATKVLRLNLWFLRRHEGALSDMMDSIALIIIRKKASDDNGFLIKGW